MVKDTDRFKSMMQKAGRLRRIATKHRKVIDRQMRSEVVDVERGADLSRVLPSQIAGLRHPKMSKLVKRNIVERSLMQYRLEGKESKGRGPVVVLLDRSGSMDDGSSDVWASAIGIAMLGVARRQKRPVTVIGFNRAITTAMHMDKRGQAFKMSEGISTKARYGLESVPFEKIDGGVASLALNIASEYSSGGTSFDPVIKTALHHLPASIKDENADLIFVTDGAAVMSDEVHEELKEAKKNGLRVFGMTISDGYVTDVMEQVCDEVMDIVEEADVGQLLGQ